MSAAKKLLQDECARRMSIYPQYKGYYDDDKGWKYAVATKTIPFKGEDIVKGETVLVKFGGTYEDVDMNFLVPIEVPCYEIAHLSDGFPELNIQKSVNNSLVNIFTARKSLRFLEE